MANTIIRIKSSGVIGNTPVTLEPGEIAINYADGKLYYGDSANDAVLFDVITEPAGLDGEIQFNNLGSFGSASGFTFETANTLLRVPNLIVGTTNVVSSITYSWDTANSATILAQSAYDLANTLSGGTTDDGYARIVANSAYNQANTATTNAATADQRAVTSGSYANAAFLHANTANQRAVTSGVYANAAFSTANNRVLRSGDAMTGALSTTSNVFAQVLYANTEFYAGIATYSATLLPNALGQFTGNSNTYIQVNEQNIDPQGTSDYVLTSDVGTDTDFYVDLGITNSQYNNQYPNNSLGTSAWPLDGYLVVKGSSINQLGGNLVIGTTSTEVPTDIKIIVGGINEQNVVARFTQSGFIVNGSTLISGNLTVNGTIDLPALTTVGLYANAAYVQANTADQRAVTSGVYANAAYNQANTATTNAATADQRAVTSGVYANSAYVQANTADQRAVTSGIYANSSFDASNTADQKAVTSGVYANSSYLHANASFIVANTKYSSSGGTISGDVNITGNLNVTGNTITHSADDFIVNDPIILLANNNPGNLLDLGFIAHYIEGGTTKHTGLVRDSSTNTFYLFDNYVPHIQETNILDINDATLRITTLRANLVSDSVLVRGYDVVDHTNSAFTQANTATTNAATADQRAVTSGVYANAAYVQANTADQRAVTSGLYANSAYNQANTATTNAATADQRAVTSGVYANAAYNQANTATTNAATADQKAITSGVYANAAFDQANTKINVNVVDDTTTNSDAYYPTLSTITTGTLSTANVSSTKLYYNPSTGQLNASNFNSLSDANKKKDIITITNPIEKVMNLRGVSFRWKENDVSAMGLIAQEVEMVIPDVVSTSSCGEKSVSYDSIIGLLVEAIKDQQNQINELKKQ